MTAIHRVSVADADVVFDCAPGQTVLDAAEAAGWTIPYSCRRGACTSCLGTIVNGTVRDRRNGRPDGPGADALLCQAVPDGPVGIRPRRIVHSGPPRRRELTARVYRVRTPAPRVVVLELRYPIGRRIPFRAGQYLEVRMPGGESRPYSLANPPRDNDMAELHVRIEPDGLFSDRTARHLRPGDVLTVEAPYGDTTVELGGRHGGAQRRPAGRPRADPDRAAVRTPVAARHAAAVAGLRDQPRRVLRAPELAADHPAEPRPPDEHGRRGDHPDHRRRHRGRADHRAGDGPVRRRVHARHPLRRRGGLVGLLGVVFGASLWLLLCVTFLVGCCVSGGQKSVIAFGSLFYPPDMRSTGVAWALGTGRVGGILGPVVVGLAMGAGWSTAQLFAALAVPMLVAAVTVLALARRQHQDAPVPGAENRQPHVAVPD